LEVLGLKIFDGGGNHWKIRCPLKARIFIEGNNFYVAGHEE
jgi:hypothetical protein